MSEALRLPAKGEKNTGAWSKQPGKGTREKCGPEGVLGTNSVGERLQILPIGDCLAVHRQNKGDAVNGGET